MDKTRNSSFELLRILSQFMIIYYHLLRVIIYPINNNSFIKALWLPLHIGVPVFVLISGYFGIHASLKRAITYLAEVFIFQVPLLIIYDFYSYGGVFNSVEVVKNIIKSLLFISETPYWYLRTYFILFLLSDIINKYLDKITKLQRFLLIIVLFYISDWIGMLGADSSLVEGKNIITFILFYVVGNTLYVYKEKIECISKKKLLVVTLLFNVFIVAIFSLVGTDNLYGTIYTKLFFAYTSPGILINSILVFMLIGSLNIQSTLINKIARSTLSMYILHGSPIIIYVILPPIVTKLYSIASNIVISVIFFVPFTLIIMACCYIIHELLTPYLRVTEKFGIYLQGKFDMIENKWSKR